MIRTLKYILLSTGLLLSGCGDKGLLDVTPRQSIDSETAVNTPEGLQAALTGVYDRLQSTLLYGRDFIAIPDALADNGRATNKSGRLNAEYQNQAGAQFLNWQTSYYAINQTNLILEGSTALTTLPDATRNSVEGQAYFLRALMYFDLMRAYAYDPTALALRPDLQQVNRGGVPLVLKGVINADQLQLPTRAPIADVYKQIYADLTAAIERLDKVTLTTAYANKGAARALFSRVALYNGDNANVVKYATEALATATGSGRFQTRDNYVGAWRTATHPESMFEIQYQINENIGVNTSLQTTYTTLVELGNRARTGGFGDLVPTKSLLDDLELEKDSVTKAVLDVRRQLYELGTTGRGTAEIEVTKFFGRSGQVNLDNIPVFRISEMYLNRAEANYRLGNAATALTDLNAIRTRAGLRAATGLSGDALLNEILRQRRLEFAFEGQRWFDLKRLGRDVVKAAPVQTLAYSDFRILAPIPTREIQANSNLKQNFGY